MFYLETTRGSWHCRKCEASRISARSQSAITFPEVVREVYAIIDTNPKVCCLRLRSVSVVQFLGLRSRYACRYLARDSCVGRPSGMSERLDTLFSWSS